MILRSLKSLLLVVGLVAMTAPATAAEEKKLRYYLVIDDSGSMAFRPYPKDMPAADTHRSAVVAIRIFAQLLGQNDRLQVLTLNSDRPIFSKPTYPAALETKGLMDKHLGPKSDIGHYTGPSTPCGAALKLLAKELKKDHEDGSEAVVLFMTDGTCTGKEPVPKAERWARRQAWRKGLSFHLVTFAGRVGPNNPLVPYISLGTGSHQQIGKSSDLLPAFAQVIARAKGGIHLYPHPEKNRGTVIGPDSAETRGFSGAAEVQLVILAEVPKGKSFKDLGFTLQKVREDTDITWKEEDLKVSEYRYDHSSLPDRLYQRVKGFPGSSTKDKLNCQGGCKNFVSAVVSYKPPERSGETVRIGLKAETWSALQLAHFRVDLERGDLQIAKNDDCQGALEEVTGKWIKPNSTLCMELEPTADGKAITDEATKDVFIQPKLRVFSQLFVAGKAEPQPKVDVEVTRVGGHWVAKTTCARGRTVFSATLSFGDPGEETEIPFHLGPVTCEAPQMDCRTKAGASELDLGTIKTGAKNARMIPLTCEGNADSTLRVKMDENGQPEGLTKPSCLHLSLEGADGAGWVDVSQGSDVNLMVRADSFCSPDDAPDYAIGGTFSLEHQESAVTGARSFNMKAAKVDFDFKFTGDPLTATLRQENKGTIQAAVKIGGRLDFKLVHPSEVEVPADDPYNREPRWLVRSTNPDRPEVFSLAPGAASFDYLLTPGRCCASAGEDLVLMLQPGEFSGGVFKPFTHVAAQRVRVPVTVSGSVISCWLPTLIQWFLWGLAIAFVIWFVGGYLRLFGRNFRFKKGSAPTAYYVNSDLPEDVVAFCQNREMGTGSHQLWKCKVPTPWRILPHPVAHGRCNRAIFGGKRKGVFKKCFVMKRSRLPIQAILYPRRNGRSFDMEVRGKKIKTWTYEPGTEEIKYQDLRVGEVQKGLGEIKIKIQNYHFVITRN